MLVTNDVDEAILLADRILPLSAGPRATLGPEFVVNIPRPRERRALNLVPEFRHLRTSIIDYLLASKRSAGGARPLASPTGSSSAGRAPAVLAPTVSPPVPSPAPRGSSPAPLL